jgi:hypothetical protein
MKTITLVCDVCWRLPNAPLAGPGQTKWPCAGAGYPRSLARPSQGNGDARPMLAGSAVSGECNVIVFDASDVLHDAFTVRGPRIDAEGEVRSRCGHL